MKPPQQGVYPCVFVLWLQGLFEKIISIDAFWKLHPLQIVHLNNIAIEIRLLHFFPLDVNKPYEVEHIETQFCEAEFAHIDDSKNIDILKGKVSSSHHFIDNLNFFYSTSKNKPANTVDAVALLHTDYAISGSKSAE